MYICLLEESKAPGILGARHDDGEGPGSLLRCIHSASMYGVLAKGMGASSTWDIRVSRMEKVPSSFGAYIVLEGNREK